MCVCVYGYCPSDRAIIDYIYQVVWTLLTSAKSQHIFILFPEAVAGWEEVPTSLLIAVPDVCFLAGVFRFILVDEVHQEEQVVGQIVLLLHVDVETVRNLVQVVFADFADEAVVLQLVLNPLHLVPQGTEGVNDETLDDGKEDDDDEEKE